MLTPKDPQVQQAILAIDPDFGPMAARVGTETWSIEGLSPADCTLLCIVNDVCNHTLAVPFEQHIQLMLANGSSYRHIKEILLHLAPYAGYPLVLETLIRLKEIGANLQLTIADEAPPKPEEVEPGDAQPYQKLLKLDENFGKFVMSETRQVWARGHLTARERVYISLAVDVFYQTLTEPFRFHLEQARQSGISLAEIKAVIRFLGEFSIGRAWEALCALVPANPAAAWS